MRRTARSRRKVPKIFGLGCLFRFAHLESRLVGLAVVQRRLKLNILPELIVLKDIGEISELCSIGTVDCTVLYFFTPSKHIKVPSLRVEKVRRIR